MIVRVSVVLSRAVVDSDWRFDNDYSSPHLQSQSGVVLRQLIVNDLIGRLVIKPNLGANCNNQTENRPHLSATVFISFTTTCSCTTFVCLYLFSTIFVYRFALLKSNIKAKTSLTNKFLFSKIEDLTRSTRGSWGIKRPVLWKSKLSI